MYLPNFRYLYSVITEFFVAAFKKLFIYNFNANDGQKHSTDHSYFQVSVARA